MRCQHTFSQSTYPAPRPLRYPERHRCIQSLHCKNVTINYSRHLFSPRTLDPMPHFRDLAASRDFVPRLLPLRRLAPSMSPTSPGRERFDAPTVSSSFAARTQVPAVGTPRGGGLLRSTCSGTGGDLISTKLIFSV